MKLFDRLLYGNKLNAIVKFKESINIDKVFLGKRIPFRLSEDIVGEILFPIFKKNHVTGDLQNQILLKDFGFELGNNFGEVAFNNNEASHPFIFKLNSMAFFLYSSISVDHNHYQEIKDKILEKIEHFWDVIKIISPHVVNKNLPAINSEYILEFQMIGTNSDKSNIGAFYLDPIVFEICPRENMFNPEAFFFALKNSEKKISLQYILKKQVLYYSNNEDYRGAILNYATIIEITLKDEIKKILKDKNEKGTIDYLIKNSDSLTKLSRVFNELHLGKIKLYKAIEKIMNIRNKTIHGRYSPTKEEFNESTITINIFLKEYNVPLFENDNEI